MMMKYKRKEVEGPKKQRDAKTTSVNPLFFWRWWLGALRRTWSIIYI
jgi:hypothetical protein